MFRYLAGYANKMRMVLFINLVDIIKMYIHIADGGVYLQLFNVTIRTIHVIYIHREIDQS